jgi:6,7-dimethyl-8-ribityllumazine synthase
MSSSTITCIFYFYQYHHDNINNRRSQMNSKVLIVEANFYPQFASSLLFGTKARLETDGISCDVISVGGALEIAQVINLASTKYTGFIALGQVIRGETTHYETVCEISAKMLADLAIYKNLLIVNGILTCENELQIIPRLNKGSYFAEQLLNLLKIKENLK